MLMELIIKFIFRGIPESCIHMYAMYTLNHRKIHKRNYIGSSVILAGCMVIITKLPISYGIHTLLVMMTLISLAVVMNGLRIDYCISIGIVNAIIQFISEGMNIFLIQKILHKDVATIMSNPLISNIYGIPSILTFFGIVWILGKITNKIKRAKDV